MSTDYPKTIRELVAALKAEFGDRKWDPPAFRSGYRHSRPGRLVVAPGYSVPGYSKWTRAVNLALPGVAHPWWSGSNPTPSTQYPTEVANYLAALDRPGED